MHMMWAEIPHLLIIHILGSPVYRFYGFILQARHRGSDEIFGEFDDDEEIHRLTCHGGVRNTVYLLQNYLKFAYDIHWISPVMILFPVEMHATIVEARNVFWTFSLPLPPYIAESDHMENRDFNYFRMHPDKYNDSYISDIMPERLKCPYKSCTKYRQKHNIKVVQDGVF